jgi:hypothetical protein
MFFKSLVFCSAFLILASCGALGMQQKSAPRPVMERSYDIEGFQFQATPGLSVSEDESFYPGADIVWRGDPTGPRIAQIEAMFKTAVARNQPVMAGNVPITVTVNLVRFHGVTKRTRYTVGGVYNIIFDLAVINARTGEVIEPPRRVVADLDAPGGATAVQLEDSGQTEKVRVVDFLTAVLRRQLI